MEDPSLWPFMSLPTASGDRLTRHPADAEAHKAEVEKLGWRHHPELATHRLVHPGGESFPWLASTGLDLVPIDAPADGVDMSAQSVPDISGLSLEQKSALLVQLRRDGFGAHDQEPPVQESAEVTHDEP